jgi:hypothetical protein
MPVLSLLDYNGSVGGLGSNFTAAITHRKRKANFCVFKRKKRRLLARWEWQRMLVYRMPPVSQLAYIILARIASRKRSFRRTDNIRMFGEVPV